MSRTDSNNQDGAASMIVVIILAIILSILTIGFIRLAISDQRQSTDFDLSQRAYYAAESGIEDAKRALSEYLRGTRSLADLNSDTCDLPTGYNGMLSTDPDFDMEYNCMFIDLTPAAYKAKLDAINQTRQVLIEPVQANGSSDTFDEMVIKWHVNAPSPDGDGVIGSTVSLRGSGDTSIPQQGTWSNPAMMEVQLIALPKTAIERPLIKDVNVFLSPNSGGTGATAGAAFLNGANTNPNPAVDAEVLAANCNPSVAADEFACEMNIDFSGFPNSRQVILRITNRYRPTTMEITLYKGGNQRFFDNVQAGVDVTGKANSVYRRVEASLDLKSPNLLPDFTIQSSTDICKDFSFTDDLSQFVGVPRTSCQI